MENRKVKNYWRNKFVSSEVSNWTHQKWAAINQRTVNGAYATAPSLVKNPQTLSYIKKNILIDMTKDEFFDWCSANESKILEMMVNNERPSIDRICEDCTYSIDNIQIIPLIDNMTKDSSVCVRVERDKIDYTLRNRRQYILAHGDYQYKELVIDYYLKNFPLKFVKEVVELDLIPDYTSWVTPETVVDDKVVSFIQRKVEEDEALKAETVAILEKKKRHKMDIEEKKMSEVKRKADKAWAKSLPEYSEMIKSLSQRQVNALLSIRGTTVQKEAIRLLKEKYNRE